MSAEARVYVLTRDEHDREAWTFVGAKPGHWGSPYVALQHFLEGDDYPAGSYRCEAGGASATGGWDGDRMVA